MKINNLKKGFTLIELLVVIIIIGLLVTAAVSSYMTSIETTKAREAITLAKQWQAGRAIYYAENGFYPNQNRLNYIGLDEPRGSFNTDNFLVDLTTASNTIVIASRNPGYVIYATDDPPQLYCCWLTSNPSRYKKLCQNLVSGATEDPTDYSYANDNYNCYTFGEID